MPEIRDPVHGPIELSPAELAVVDSPIYQRLRNVKQLGFAEMTFPGGVHNRYLHGLGAMYLAGRAFDAAFEEADWLAGAERVRMRQTIRLSALLHDVGHPPLSHTLETLLPHLSQLPHGEAECEDRQATHEDMTIAITVRSSLTERLLSGFQSIGVTPDMVAGLIDPSFRVAEGSYHVAGRDLRPILSQMVSSELDVDRMDYLLRDAYFTGATYGNYDVAWLVGSLTHHEVDGRVNLGLKQRAILTFEDFLLSRYHMFQMVYYHHRTSAYDRMLQLFFEALEERVELPGAPDDYIEWDDPRIYAILRHHRACRWSRRILDRDPIRRVIDLEGEEAASVRSLLNERLAGAEIEGHWIRARGILSKYYGISDDPARRIFVLDRLPGARLRALPLEEATELFTRYREPRVRERLFVAPSALEGAREIAAGVLDGG